MGKRKERRLASKSAAGRRVKLDLFAEPSGDLGGSPSQEEVGGDSDFKTHAELPSSPSSSSGKQPPNPLLLLEQYSDEELDEISNEGHNHAVAENSSIGIDEEEKVIVGKVSEDSENNAGKEPIIQMSEQLLMDKDSASQDPLQKHEKGSTAEDNPDDFQRPKNRTEEAVVPDEHLVGDASSGWKMVLHEESNQYYYWNIVTGETSWEVPDVLAQQTVTSENVVGDIDRNMGAEQDAANSRKLNVDSKINYQSSYSADRGAKQDGSNEGVKGDFVVNEEGNSNAKQSHGTSLLDRHSLENRGGADLSSQLINHCENLLERLNSLKRLKCYVEGEDLNLKCRLEIEVRLADIKALASHGSSLLPFWLHSEDQLKWLEAAVDEVIQRHNSASTSRLEATLQSSEGIGDGIEVGSSEKKALFPIVESQAEDISKKSSPEAHNDGATTEHIPSVCQSSTFPVSDVGGKSEITGTNEETELPLRPASQTGEDVDMDVDMEVEDTTSIRSPHGDASGAHYHVSTELSNLQNALANQEVAVPDQMLNVPPPVEDWIPPPPPDNEPVPPPPPDDEPFPPPPPNEPTETSYPPSSHFEPVQPFPYAEQYTSYPGSNIEYYGQTHLEVPGTTLYSHPEGGQVALPNLPHYYEAASNVYAVTPLVVNPVEPTAYYGLQNETLNAVSSVSGTVESSATQIQHVPETLGPGTGQTLSSHVDSLLPRIDPNVVNSGNGTLKVPPDIPDAQPSVAEVSSSGLGSSTSDTSTSLSAAAAAAATANSKVQSKASRSKKRNVAVVSTLRSNKKVSSLVDKWKAAKEELHEEEEEPEDAYEILEKKRKREIEEWRAQQIASGEAKDNANFQPLGGDWRERVKRKRAERMKNTDQSSADVAADGKQQGDLVELSKGLPSGWQVYWDDSSKQVYYGNTRTSETTWSRPTD